MWFLIVITIFLIAFDIYLVARIKKKDLPKQAAIKCEIQSSSQNLDWIRDQYNTELERFNEILREEDQSLEKQNKLKADCAVLTEKYEDLQKYTKNADEEFKIKLEILDAQYALKEKELNDEYERSRKEEEDRFAQVTQEFLSQWNDLNESLKVDKEKLIEEVEQQRTILNSAIDAAKRAQLEQIKKDYYKILLDPVAQEDIIKLRSIESSLAQPESLNKIIWKVYYEKPVSDMIGRVVGNTTKTGIYKITNCENGMAYVGQAVDIASRYRQHIKRGIGAETPTQNKLYPAMKKIGPENFMFEILEECTRDKLDAQEDYWQDFYRVKEFGYSIK